VSDSNTPSNKQDITSRTLEIENGFIRAGEFSIQIANIVSMSVKENTRRAVKATAVGYAITFCVLLALSRHPPVAIAASPVVALICSYRAFRGELLIVTSAGTSFLILSRRKKFLDELKAVIEMVKIKGDSYHYTVNRHDNRIIDNSIQANTTAVANSNLLNASVGNPTHDVRTGDQIMAEYKNLGQVGAMGDRARSDNNAFSQAGPGPTIDLAALAKQLAQVRAEMRRVANPDDPTHDAEIGAIAQAETAAKSGNKSKALEVLKGAGNWALDVAKSIAASLVEDAIEGKFGS
jgi:hypothetical protein